MPPNKVSFRLIGSRSLKVWSQDKRRCYIFYADKTTDVLNPNDIEDLRRMDSLIEVGSSADQPAPTIPKSFHKVGIPAVVNAQKTAEPKADKKAPKEDDTVTISPMEVVKKIIETQKGPDYKCVLCGKTGLTKASLKSHVGSKPCNQAALEAETKKATPRRGRPAKNR